MNKKVYSLIHVIIIIVVTAIISALTTGVLFTKSAINRVGVNYGDIASDENVKTFLNAYSEVVNGYYKDIDKSAVINSAISGMMEYLNEPYTTYLDDTNADILVNQLNGTYKGIGISIKDNLVVSTVIDSPAEKAGVLAGDIIVAINDEDVSGKTSNEITGIIKNIDDEITLRIKRNEEVLSFKLKSETLNIPSVEYKMIDDTNIGYIKMTIFSSNLTNEVKTAVLRLENAGMESLILDMRNNSGGYLEKAHEVASLFIKKDKLIYSLEDKNNKVDYKDQDDSEKNYPIVVLINGSTASAAEIVTAALKDSYGATLVGLKSFGKGKVQHTYRLDTGGMVKYTSSNWLRPDGSCIDGIGITPDYVIENENIYDSEDINKETIIDTIDHQLNKAIELLSN